MEPVAEPATEQLARASTRTAEAIREIGHLRSTDEPFDTAALCHVTGQLSLVAGRLDDVLRMLADHVERRHEGFVLGHDANGDVDATIVEITTAPSAAASVLDADVGRHLSVAHNALARLEDPGDRRDS